MHRGIATCAVMVTVGIACSSKDGSPATSTRVTDNASAGAGASAARAPDLSSGASGGDNAGAGAAQLVFNGEGGAPSLGTGGSVVAAGQAGVPVSSAGGTKATNTNSSEPDIGTWIDAPGACPIGMTRVEIATATELASATRGEDRYASDPSSVCYFIRNGQYVQSGNTLNVYIKKGGTDGAHRRLFVGESRSGVVIKGRASIETGASHVQLSNLTFDLAGYSQSGSFNTLTLSGGSTDLLVSKVTFTGDCKTGSKGGHVEVNGSTSVLVEDCLIEKFGHCGPDGHLDHGVYLASGSNITLRNSEIRGNASRGIQLNTESGSFGTLDKVVIERNRVHDNGHADYEDGIAMNAQDTGTISNVTIRNNLVYNNYYSGLREVGDAFRAVAIEFNTFYQNGAKSSGSGRSELNLDDVGSGANTVVSLNIIVAANRILNSCYDAQPRGFALPNNLVLGNSLSGTAANCISGSVAVDPNLRDPANADFHPQNPAASGYGAYAP